MKNIPNKIYLQVDPEKENPEFFGELETTWCSDRINDNDIPYYRKQVKTEPDVNVQVAEETLKEILEMIRREFLFATENYPEQYHSMVRTKIERLVVEINKKYNSNLSE